MVLGIVQARMASKRLPGKVMLKVEGKTLLHHLLLRLERSALLDSIVVATGPGPDNEVIRDEAIRLGYDCPYTMRHEDDVLGRYIDVANLYQGGLVVRITGDCPLIDAEVVDKTIDALGKHDFASNVVRRTYPRGLDVEVMPRSTLQWLDSHLISGNPAREHVCSFLYHTMIAFRIISVFDEENNSDLVWCVDDMKDFDKVAEMLRWGILPYKDVLRRALGS